MAAVDWTWHDIKCVYPNRERYRWGSFVEVIFGYEPIMVVKIQNYLSSPASFKRNLNRQSQTNDRHIRRGFELSHLMIRMGENSRKDLVVKTGGMHFKMLVKLQKILAGMEIWLPTVFV